MKAEDTEKLAQRTTNRRLIDVVTETQAEITWKARDSEIQEAYKAGERKMIEWIIEHKQGYYAEPDGTLLLVISASWTKEEWQEISSWEIEPDEEGVIR